MKSLHFFDVVFLDLGTKQKSKFWAFLCLHKPMHGKCGPFLLYPENERAFSIRMASMMLTSPLKALCWSSLVIPHLFSIDKRDRRSAACDLCSFWERVYSNKIHHVLYTELSLYLSRHLSPRSSSRSSRISSSGLLNISKYSFTATAFSII